MDESEDLWRARLSRRDRPGDPRVTPLGSSPAMLGYAPTGAAFPSQFVDLHPIRITGSAVAGEPPTKEIDESSTVRAWVNPTRRPLRRGSEAVAHFVPYQWIVADGVPPSGVPCNICGRIYLAETLTLVDPVYGPLTLTYDVFSGRWKATLSIPGIWRRPYTGGVVMGCSGTASGTALLRYEYSCFYGSLVVIIDACIGEIVDPDHPTLTHVVASEFVSVGGRTQAFGGTPDPESTCDPFRRVFSVAYDPSVEMNNAFVEIWGDSGMAVFVLTGKFE